jgi:hypothetical protein
LNELRNVVIYKKLITAAFAALLPVMGAACPDYNKSGDTYALSGYELYDGVALELRAGGEYEVNACGIRPRTDRGQGYFTSPPDVTLSLSKMNKYQLVIDVVSECDSVLLINTGSASWYYDDDDNGNGDAKIILTRPSNGWLDIWVGTHDGSVCDAILSLETYHR